MIELLEMLKVRYSLTGIREQKNGQFYLTVAPEHLVDLITALKDVYGFRHLVFATAVDRIEDGFFRLIYMLQNHEKMLDFGVQIEVPRDNTVVESIHHLWKQAATYQREMYEMYGISFPGSPRMSEPFMLEGWSGTPPMRREFDTKKYSEEKFYPRPGRKTNDPAAYMAEKLDEEGAVND